MPTSSDPGALKDLLASALPDLLAVRHDIHQHPELGFDEHRTQGVVMEWLKDRGYEPRQCAGTGVVADLNPGKATLLALRADLDALPIQEHLDVPYRSVHDGVSHKCGHDGHTTILLAVAHLLAGRRAELDCNVRLVFQPAEEGIDGGGAKVMIAEGVLDGVPEMYGLHNWPGFPKGSLRVVGGATMAAVDTIRLVLRGRGGHGSQPQTCRDPIVAGAQIVTAVQTVVSRGLSALESGVVSFGSFQAGGADNVIPSVAELTGSIRTLNPGVRERVHARLRGLVEGMGPALGVQVDLRINPEYPVLVNDSACAEVVARVASKLGFDVSDEQLPLLASEDFAFFANEIPSAYFFLGAGVEGQDTPGCHHPDFDFDDDLIAKGAAVFMGLLEDRLAASR
jgi:amidohydrolase